MARSTYLGTDDHYVFVAPNGAHRNPTKTVTIRFWDSEVGGTQHTDLLIDGQPATEVVIPAAKAGNPPFVEGPEGVNDGMWMDAFEEGAAPGPRVFTTSSRPLTEAKAHTDARVNALTAADVNALPDTTTPADIGAQAAASLNADVAALPAVTAKLDKSEATATIATAAVAPTNLLHKPEGLRRWWAAYGGALDSLVGISCIGDSTVAGVGADDIGTLNPPASSVTIQKSWPAQLRRLFAQQYGDAGEGFVRGTDDRTTPGAGVSTSNAIGPVGGAKWVKAGQTLTFNLPACTDLDIMVWTNNSAPTTGTFSWAIDGGAATTVNPGTAANTHSLVSITGQTDATHTLLITGVTGDSYIAGVRVRRKTSGVQTYRLGEPGYTSLQLSGHHATTLANRWPAQRTAATVTLPQALSIIMVGHNDWLQQNTSQTYGASTPANYKAELQEWINTAVGGGGCVLLVSQVPPPATQTVTNEVYPISAYWQAMRELADANDHVAHLRLTDLYGTQANAQALGLQINNSVHSNSRGYGDIARTLHRVLTSPGFRQ